MPLPPPSKTPKKKKLSIYGNDIRKGVVGMDQSMSKILKGEQKNRPGFQALNLGDVNSFLGGTGGQQGIIGAGGAASQASQAQINAARNSELANMAGNTGTVRSLLSGLSPESAAAVSRANSAAHNSQGLESDFMGRSAGMMAQYGSQVGQYNPTLGGVNAYADPTISGANADPRMAQQMAMEAYARRGTLSQEEQRAAQQSAREASIASGRIGGNGSIAAEVLNREASMAGRRAEAAGMGQQAYGQTMGAAQQQFANEQAQFGQQSSNIDRNIALRQAQFGQSLAAGQQNMSERNLGFSQLLGIESQRGLLRDEAANANNRSYDMSQGFYSQPGMQMLGMTPASMGMGQNYLSQGMGAIGAGTPQLYDAGAYLNLGAAERKNKLEAAAAAAQTDASKSAGLSGMIGGIATGVGTLFGGPLGGMAGAALGGLFAKK